LFKDSDYKRVKIYQQRITLTVMLVNQRRQMTIIQLPYHSIMPQISEFDH